MASDLSYSLYDDTPLPPCKGPKLQRFKSRGARVEFLRFLSSNHVDEDSSGAHSHVFEVRIGKVLYALKIFKFYDIPDLRDWIGDDLEDFVSDETLTYHTDPFFAECRAYGRINQYKERLRHKLGSGSESRRARIKDWADREIAVPCYGYLGLPANPFEEILTEKFGITDWRRPQEDEQQDEHLKQPFRALVKKLVDAEVAVTNPRKMLLDLKKLRKEGIYPKDIYARNYKMGLLVDFSLAWTRPYWEMATMSEELLEFQLDDELYLFDEMIEAEGIITTVRATRNWQYCRKLRSIHTADEDEDGV